MSAQLVEAPAAAPAYATAPTPGAVHDLHKITLTAQALGTPLMPWQATVARVASERRADDPRRFRYPIVVLTVPRQSGKTTLMRAVLAQRALMMPNRTAFYTAQTGKDARARWSDLVKQIELGPFANHVQKRIAAGTESLTFPTGSTISPFAPTAKSLHGYTPHDVMLDEIFAWDEAQGSDLMGAIKPAQVTLPDRQLWLVSTMGTKDSEFLHGWVAAGRAAVADPGAGVAYFEWSLADGLDAYDPANWGFHPALGHTIGTEDLAEAAGALTPGEWNRAYMNRRSATSEAFLDMARYDAATDPDQLPPAGRVVLAYEADPQRRAGAIVAAWYGAGGQPQLRTVVARAGTDWLVPQLVELRGSMRPGAIGADDAGATRAVTEQLERSPGHWGDLVKLGPRDFATACGELKAHVEAGAVTLGESPAMRGAFENVATRPLGEAWAMSRTKSAGPICEAVAAAVALRLLTNTRPAVQPMVYG